MSTPTVLKKILERKAEEVAERSQQVSLDALREQAAAASPVRGFVAAMERKLAAGHLAAEAKVAMGGQTTTVLLLVMLYLISGQ